MALHKKVNYAYNLLGLDVNKKFMAHTNSHLGNLFYYVCNYHLDKLFSYDCNYHYILNNL